MTTPGRKRMRLQNGSTSVNDPLEPSATMNDLPSEVMKSIFSFVGKGNYCFIAPVSKDFCYNYLTMDVIEDKFAHKMDCQLAIGRNKITTAEAASSCFELAEHCFLKAPEKFQKLVVRKAVVKGKKDIVEMGEAMGVDILDSISLGSKKENLFKIARRGDLEMFQFLQQKGVNFKNQTWTIIHAAAENGQLEILKLVHENNFWLPEERNCSVEVYFRCTAEATHYQKYIFEEAAKNGHTSIIEWAKDAAGFDFPEFMMSSVAASGNLDVIKYLRSRDISWDHYTFCQAAFSGNIALIQYLLENECPRGDLGICICTSAVRNNDHQKALEVLQWLHNQGYPWDAGTFKTAAKEGNLEALKYMQTNGCECNEVWMKQIVKSRNAEVVAFLFQIGCPIGNDDLCSIAMNDEDHDRALKMLKVLREFSVPWNSEACKAAAEAGNFQALKWCVSQGCPWDRHDVQWCARYAAEHGNIEVLKWMKSHALGWNECIGAGATKKGHLETLKFLRSDGCPFNEDSFANAIQSGNFAMVEYCVNNDPSSDYSFYETAIGHFEDPIPVLKLFQKKQYPWDELACTHAARKGDLKLLRWLRFQGFPWDEKTCNEAVKNDDLDILKYAHENGCPWTKETYAYCFSTDGLFYNTDEIPTDHHCSDQIIEYLQIQKCPQPEQEDWWDFDEESIGDY